MRRKIVVPRKLNHGLLICENGKSVGHSLNTQSNGKCYRI